MFRAIFEFIQNLGNTSIDVYEINQNFVQRKRLPNSLQFKKFAKKLPELEFNGWSLAHAVVKADYLDQRNLTMPGIGFLLQTSNILELGTSPITLKTGASIALNDFSLTSLSGRVGQGLAILYGHRLGLKFNAHLHSYVASLPVSAPGHAHLNKKMADFLFSNGTQHTLIESKGSFKLQQNDQRRIKSVLKSALKNQIDPWMKALNPPPVNGYVIYSCLRENQWAPSAIFVVDPEANGNDLEKFSLDQIKRENYGAWLRAMGLHDAASRLVNRVANEELQREEHFLLYEIGERTYAYREMRSHRCYRPWYLQTFVGLDLEVLNAISLTLKNKGLLSADFPDKANEHTDEVSIFPDGSIFGDFDGYKYTKSVKIKM